MGRPGQIILCMFLLGVLGFNGGVFAQEEEVLKLRPFNIRKDKVTLSGFSSGSAMATTLHMAHSSLFSGVALFSMAYYRCGNGNLIEFGLGCSTWLQQQFPIEDIFPRYNISRAVADTRSFASRGWIDPLEGLANQKVFVWTGRHDTLIPFDVAEQNYDFYSNFIPNTDNLVLTTHAADHDFPTTNSTITRPCRDPATEKDTHRENILATGPKFVNCNYSGAYEMMKFMIGDEIVRPSDDLPIGQLQPFNQTEFYYGTNMTHVSMQEFGWIYIPEYCRDGTNECLLHFHFHGCGQSNPPSDARRTFTTAGFLHMGEANNVIMVFPLTKPTLVSLNGCWDFFAHTGSDYATQQGAHIKMLHRMLDRLLEISDNNPNPTPDCPDPDPSSAISAMAQIFLVGLSTLLLATIN